MGYNLLINGVYWGYSPLILTIDPNFLGHPSIQFTTITLPQSLTAISHRTWNMGFGWFRHEFLFGQTFLGGRLKAKRPGPKALNLRLFLRDFGDLLKYPKTRGKGIQAIMMPSHSRHPSYGHLFF